MERRFKYKISDDILRTMNREQYYTAMRWLRSCCRIVHEQTNWDVVDKSLTDLAVYGYSEVNSEDLGK